MTKYLSDGSSEYCVCWHNMKDHEIRHVEGTTTHISEGKIPTSEEWKGLSIFCWGKNPGGINCISEREKRFQQKHAISSPLTKSDPLLKSIVICLCKQFRPYKRNDSKQPIYCCDVCGNKIESCKCPHINEYVTICDRCYKEDKAWEKIKNIELSEWKQKG